MSSGDKSKSELKFKADVNLLNNDNNITSGLAEILDFQYRSGNGVYRANSILLKMLNSSNIHTTTLNAPFAKLNYSGPEPIDNFVKKAINMIAK